MKNKQERAIVITFGRFAGVTKGHSKLINKVVDTARSLGIEHRIYTSHSFDSSKNPIPYKTKITFLRQLFPHANIAESDIKTLWQLLPAIENEGFTKVYLVVGSDRVQEFRRELKRYTIPKNDKRFRKGISWSIPIEVVSAGERDPNAQGVEGASGTKMRQFVSGGDFESFFQNSPTKNRLLAKSMYNIIRQNLREDTIINEGIYDPSIFKCVILGGGPGSGKDTILKITIAGNGLVELNRDHAFEMLMKRENLDMRMPDSETEKRNIIRTKAKSTHIERARLAFAQRLGIIINGTADDIVKIQKIKQRLEALGYSVMMLFVNTTDDISRERNMMRGKMGGREVPESVRKEKWEAAQKNVEQYRELFGNDFVLVDNSQDFRTASKDHHDMLNAASKKVSRFCNGPINRIAQAWIVRQKQKRNIVERITIKQLKSKIKKDYQDEI